MHHASDLLLPREQLELPVTGRHLAGPTLADNLTGVLRLLVFLRHFG